MMRKARLAIRKVNVALDSPGYCFGNVSLPFTRTGLSDLGEEFESGKQERRKRATVRSCPAAVIASGYGLSQPTRPPLQLLARAS
jgi:hypothetical protein